MVMTGDDVLLIGALDYCRNAVMSDCGKGGREGGREGGSE